MNKNAGKKNENEFSYIASVVIPLNEETIKATEKESIIFEPGRVNNN